MTVKNLAAGIAVLLFSLSTSAMSANFTIDNPASNIYNPAVQMDNPSPLSPVIQPVPQPPVTKKNTAEQVKEPPSPHAERTVPHKNYYFKTVGAYMAAAKKAFNREDYVEFISLTEDALRRIDAGTLRATKKTKLRLATYKKIGYGLLEKDGSKSSKE